MSCHEALIQEMVRPGGQSLLSPKLYETHIPENLAKSLLRSQTSEQLEFRRFFDSDNSQENRENLAIAVQTEQIEILKLLFTLFFKNQGLGLKNEGVVGLMINYLQDSCRIDYSQAHSMAHLPKYSANRSIIEGMTQLVCLAMVQLNVSFNRLTGQSKPVISSKSNKQTWSILMNEDNLS